jgi:hypothetical protein
MRGDAVAVSKTSAAMARVKAFFILMVIVRGFEVEILAEEGSFTRTAPASYIFGQPHHRKYNIPQIYFFPTISASDITLSNA